MSRIHVALFTPGYPHVDAPIRAMELSRRHGASFSRSIGEPLSVRRDHFVRWFLEQGDSHALLLEGDVVPPEDALERMLDAGAPVVTAAYPHLDGEQLRANVKTPGDDAWATAIPAKRFAVSRCLLGCVLVRREVFATIGSPWFLSTMTASGFLTDDEWFCTAVARAGLSIVCDGRVLCSAFRQGTDLRLLAPELVQRT